MGNNSDFYILNKLTLQFCFCVLLLFIMFQFEVTLRQ